MKFILGILIGFILASTFVLADNISSPPPLKDSALFHYLRQIYENLHRLPIVTSTPNGTRRGKKGDQVHLQTGGNIYHCENSDSLTTWRCVQLTDTP